MQTFLPYRSFIKSVQALDYRRLGKQRVEARQIYNTLLQKRLGITTKTNRQTGKVRKIGWLNHPAVLMWLGYEDALAQYHNLCIEEWVRRGYNNTMDLLPHSVVIEQIEMPKWVGNRKFHNSHKSNLLRKDRKFYSQYKWKVGDDLPYIWPKGKSI